MKDAGALKRIFDNINISKFPKDATSGIRTKKAYDGFHIYDSSAFKKKTEMHKDLNRVAVKFKYKSKYSKINEDKYINLLRWLKSNDIEVFIFMAPYHPELYDLVNIENSHFIELEQKFKDIALSLGVKIIGSFNPRVFGCNEGEFIDLTHPKESCLKKVMSVID